MKFNKITVIIVLNILCTILLGFGVYASFYSDVFSQPVIQENIKDQAAKPPSPNEISVVGIGDSLMKGLGDEEGKGFFVRVMDEIKSNSNKKVSYANFGINGYRSRNVLSLLEEPGVQKSISGANIICLSIGGNDVFPKKDETKLGNQELILPDPEVYIRNMKKILDRFIQLNPTAVIYWIGLYDPFEEFTEIPESGQAVQFWNIQSETISQVYPNVIFVPIYDLFKGNTSELLYSDHFHPNNKGYEQIANRLYQNIRYKFQLEGKGKS